MGSQETEIPLPTGTLTLVPDSPEDPSLGCLSISALPMPFQCHGARNAPTGQHLPMISSRQKGLRPPLSYFLTTVWKSLAWEIGSQCPHRQDLCMQSTGLNAASPTSYCLPPPVCAGAVTCPTRKTGRRPRESLGHAQGHIQRRKPSQDLNPAFQTPNPMLFSTPQCCQAFPREKPRVREWL